MSRGEHSIAQAIPLFLPVIRHLLYGAGYRGEVDWTYDSRCGIAKIFIHREKELFRVTDDETRYDQYLLLDRLAGAVNSWEWVPALSEDVEEKG